jgi:hypothetical protein
VHRILEKPIIFHRNRGPTWQTFRPGFIAPHLCRCLPSYHRSEHRSKAMLISIGDLATTMPTRVALYEDLVIVDRWNSANSHPYTTSRRQCFDTRRLCTSLRLVRTRCGYLSALKRQAFRPALSAVHMDRETSRCRKELLCHEPPVHSYLVISYSILEDLISGYRAHDDEPVHCVTILFVTMDAREKLGQWRDPPLIS